MPAKKVINKIKRKERAVREATQDVVKMNRMEEVLQDSPGSQKVMRGIQRRLDKSFGYDSLGQEPALEYVASMTAVERFDFDPGAGFDYGIRLTMPAAVLSGSGLQPGDLVQFKEGLLEGRMLQVVSVVDATHVRLDDAATYVGPESNVVVRMVLSGVKKAFV